MNIQIKREKNLEKYNELILNPIKSKDYLILRGLLCFIRNNNDSDSFFFIQSSFKNGQFFIFKKSSYDLFKLNNHFDKVDQLIVISEENCIEDYSKLKCLNQCFKRNHLFSKYIYNGNESGIVYLNYEYNQTIKDKEFGCLENDCKRNDCKLVHFVSIRRYDKRKTSIYKHTYLISRLEYCIQLTGLICLIGSIYINQLLSILFEYIKSKVNYEKCFHLIKLVILLICVGFFLYYFTVKIENIFNQMNSPIKTEAKTYQLESERINLAICLSAEWILKENMTFLKLEKATDRGFNDTIDEIFLEFLGKKSKIEWKLRPEILFKPFLTVYRCFQVQINSFEQKYQSQLATSKLKIKTKNDLYRLLLLPENETLNSNSYLFEDNNFVKKIIKRSKTNEKCINYEKKYSVCYSKRNCIDRCVNLKFMKYYNSITIHSVIDKQHFTKDQWSNLFLNNDFKKYNKTKEECKRNFQINDCYEIAFENSV